MYSNTLQFGCKISDILHDIFHYVSIASQNEKKVSFNKTEQAISSLMCMTVGLYSQPCPHITGQHQHWFVACQNKVLFGYNIEY